MVLVRFESLRPVRLFRDRMNHRVASARRSHLRGTSDGATSSNHGKQFSVAVSDIALVVVHRAFPIENH